MVSDFTSEILWAEIITTMIGGRTETVHRQVLHPYLGDNAIRKSAMG